MTGHHQSSNGNGPDREEAEDVQPNIEIKLTPPTPESPVFPEFAHLRDIIPGGTKDPSIRDGRVWLSPDSAHTELIPNFSFPSPLSTTVFGSRTNSSVTYNNDITSLLSRPLPPIPEPEAWTESVLQIPRNALIPNFSKIDDHLPLLEQGGRTSKVYTLSSTPGIPFRNSKRLRPYGSVGEMFKQWGRTPEIEGRNYKRIRPSTPGIPLRSSKRLMQFGSIGEVLGKRSNTPLSRHFDQNSEVAEWIKILRKKAGVTVESIQNPPPPANVRVRAPLTCLFANYCDQFLFSISSDECEKAVKPYRCPYIVIKLDEDDTNHVPIWKRRLLKTTPLLFLLTISSYILYVVLRIMYTASAQKAQTASDMFSKLSWVFVLVEIGITCKLLMFPQG